MTVTDKILPSEVHDAIEALLKPAQSRHGAIKAVFTIARPKGLENDQTLIDVVNATRCLLLERFDEEAVYLGISVTEIPYFLDRNKISEGDSGIRNGALTALQNPTEVQCHFTFNRKPDFIQMGKTQQAVDTIQEHFSFYPPIQFNTETGGVTMNLTQARTLGISLQTSKPGKPESAPISTARSRAGRAHIVSRSVAPEGGGTVIQAVFGGQNRR